MKNYEITVFSNKLTLEDMPPVRGGWSETVWGIQSNNFLPYEECSKVMDALGMYFAGVDEDGFLDYDESDDIRADCATLYPEKGL